MCLTYDHSSPGIEVYGQRSRSSPNPKPQPQRPTAIPIHNPQFPTANRNPNTVGLTSILNPGQFSAPKNGNVACGAEYFIARRIDNDVGRPRRPTVGSCGTALTRGTVVTLSNDRSSWLVSGDAQQGYSCVDGAGSFYRLLMYTGGRVGGRCQVGSGARRVTEVIRKPSNMALRSFTIRLKGLNGFDITGRQSPRPFVQ